MKTAEQSLLGKAVAWPDRYDPSLLFPIARAIGRAELRLGSDPLPFVGYDLWTAYEVGWLDRRGKPRVGMAELRVSAASTNLIESKSLKLYLNSLAQTCFDTDQALCDLIGHDLSAAANAEVVIVLLPPAGAMAVRELEGDCIDHVDLDIDDYGPPNCEHLHTHGEEADEALVSHLFRSNCPVTGQPDWASVQIRCRGPRIDRVGLLRYLISYRTHNGFHEQCVEQMFRDLSATCQPEALSVYARFTRRGGLDINPWRATPGYASPPPTRCARQ